MLRGTGQTLAKKLTSWNTCVESKSGLNFNDATTSIPERVKGMDSSNTVVLHLGTNDIDFTDEPDLAVKYSHLIRKIRSNAPDCSVVVTAVANQLQPCFVNTNQKIDTLNNSLRSTYNLDNKCHFVNCNPPVKESFYKRDGFHFNYKGSHFFANCLHEQVKFSQNTQPHIYITKDSTQDSLYSIVPGEASSSLIPQTDILNVNL